MQRRLICHYIRIQPPRSRHYCRRHAVSSERKSHICSSSYRVEKSKKISRFHNFIIGFYGWCFENFISHHPFLHEMYTSRDRARWNMKSSFEGKSIFDSARCSFASSFAGCCVFYFKYSVPLIFFAFSYISARIHKNGSNIPQNILLYFKGKHSST